MLFVCIIRNKLSKWSRQAKITTIIYGDGGNILYDDLLLILCLARSFVISHYTCSCGRHWRLAKWSFYFAQTTQKGSLSASLVKGRKIRELEIAVYNVEMKGL